METAGVGETTVTRAGDCASIAARIQRLPTTRFSCLIVLFAAGALILEALDIGVLGTILPVLRKVFALPPSQVGLLVASSTIGIVIGMIPAGRLADRFGRKPLLITGILWFTAGTAIAGLSPSFTFLLIVRGLSGLGMAAVFIVPYTIVSEFVSDRCRAAFAGILETALGLGYLFAPLLGLVVIRLVPPALAWRVFFLVASAPILYVWVIWRYMPESPRWLSRVGKTDEADRVLTAIEARIERITGRPLPSPCTMPADVSSALPTAAGASLGSVWRPPYLTRTIGLICGFVGVGSMWYLAIFYVPSIFVAHHIVLSSALLFTLVINAAQIPGKLLNGVLGEIIGRKGVYVIYTLLAVIGVYCFGRASTPLALVVFGSLMMFAAAGSAPSYKMWYAECYPTPIRATGQSTVESIGIRLIAGVGFSYFFPQILSAFGSETTMTIVAIMGCISLIIGVALIPETNRRTLEELEAGVLRPRVA